MVYRPIYTGPKPIFRSLGLRFRTLVLQSPEENGGNIFLNTQGDRYVNGGIQVWIFESVGDPTAGLWRLRNLKLNAPD